MAEAGSFILVVMTNGDVVKNKLIKLPLHVLSSQPIPFSCSTHFVILASTNMTAAAAVKTRQGIVAGFSLL